MLPIILLFLCILLKTISNATAPHSIRGGVLNLHSGALIADCLSGRHLQTYSKTCAPYLRTQMDAVVVAVLQGLPIKVLPTNSSVDQGGFGLLQRGKCT